MPEIVAWAIAILLIGGVAWLYERAGLNRGSGGRVYPRRRRRSRPWYDP